MSYGWNNDLAVVTGRSGGVSSLSTMGARVVVLDINPLEYKPKIPVRVLWPKSFSKEPNASDIIGSISVTREKLSSS